MVIQNTIHRGRLIWEAVRLILLVIHKLITILITVIGVSQYSVSNTVVIICNIYVRTAYVKICYNPLCVPNV